MVLWALLLIFMMLIAPPIAINGLDISPLFRAILFMLSLVASFGLWSFISRFLLIAASGMYGFKKLRIGRLSLEVSRNRKARTRIKRDAVSFLFLSVILLIYSFSILYGLISVLDNNAFNSGQLSFVSALYFSFLAITNSFQEDILPISDTVRLLTIIEMAFGMFYALFFFSYLALFVREGRGGLSLKQQDGTYTKRRGQK